MKHSILLLTLLMILSGASKGQLSNLKFDVALRLDHYIISNVRDLDGTEDLYTGEQIFGGNTIGYHMRLDTAYVNNTSIGDILNGTQANFFYIDKSSNSQPNGTYSVNEQETIFKDLSLTQLKNIVLVLGGMSLNDEEGLLPPREFFCVDCGQRSSFRTIRFAEMSSTQTSINNLKNNGLPQALSFGADKYFELNYYENFKKEDGWVKFKWMVWVTPHN